PIYTGRELVLAHELIHSLRGSYGLKDVDTDGGIHQDEEAYVIISVVKKVVSKNASGEIKKLYIFLDTKHVFWYILYKNTCLGDDLLCVHIVAEGSEKMS
ncbi:MAG: hypothetical protein PHI90_03195, partial [Clostridia bacterium]|nr:hypothetical protein [Clostridia bacterium]